jgi:hypothetical protein
MKCGEADGDLPAGLGSQTHHAHRSTGEPVLNGTRRMKTGISISSRKGAGRSGSDITLYREKILSVSIPFCRDIQVLTPMHKIVGAINLNLELQS